MDKRKLILISTLVEVVVEVEVELGNIISEDKCFQVHDGF